MQITQNGSLKSTLMAKSKFWIFYGPIRPGSKFVFFELKLKSWQYFDPNRPRSVNVSLRNSWELIIINRWKLSTNTSFGKDPKKTKKPGLMLKNSSVMVKKFLRYTSLRQNSVSSTRYFITRTTPVQPSKMRHLASA